MPKMKTNRAARKRFRKTGGSKIKRGTAYRRHLLTNKKPKRRRISESGMPNNSKILRCTAGSVIRIDPLPSSLPLYTAS